MYSQEDTYWWYVGRRHVVNSLVRWCFGGRRDVRVLDVGCGTGATLASLTQWGEVVGVDLSPVALELSRRRGLELLALSPAELLPFRSESFDLVTLLDVLEHLPDETTALTELARVLRPGGFVVITVPAYQWLWSGHDEALHHRRRYTAGQLRVSLQRAGLRAARMSYAISLALVPTVVFRWLQRLYRGASAPRTALIPLPRPLNALLIALLALEARWLRHGNLPAGVSVVCCVEKDRSSPS